ncbi:MAG: CaiB/BaiF CoA-transferase family protein [Bacteroidota bacterium]
MHQIPPTQLFSNLKVIELAGVLAGPAVGMFFAELGATVIKVENKLTGGDVTRGWKITGEDATAPLSSYYHSVNWGKQSVLVNLKEEQDRNHIYTLLKDADIVITNYKKEDAIKLGMDYETIKTIQPAIIYAHLKGFENSPRVAFDAIVQAETGFMSMNGSNESGPLKLPVAFMDMIAAHLLKEGILTALLQRHKTGEGCYVETSLEKAGLSSLINQSSAYLNHQVVPTRMGSLHPNIAPYGETFVTADGKLILLAVGSDEQFRKLCTIIYASHISDDVKFATNHQRVKNRDELASLLQQYIRNLNSSELILQLETESVPAGIIRNLKDVLDQPSTKKYILEQKEEDGTISKRMMTAAFSLYK